MLTSTVAWDQQDQRSTFRVAVAATAGARREYESAILRREGEYWTVVYAGRTIRLRHAKGISHLAQLLRFPGLHVHCLDLTFQDELPDGAISADRYWNVAPLNRDGDDAGEIIDRQACSAYRHRLVELRDELGEAERANDIGHCERLRWESEFVSSELSAALGLSGHHRRASSRSERARVNVTRALRLVLRRIAKQHPELGEHLNRTIRTGTYCTYAPDPRLPIEWEI